MRHVLIALASAAALALALPLVARRADSAEPAPPATGARPFPTVAVTGTVELAIAPDEAWLHLGVETFLPTMERAVTDNDTRMAAVLNALKAAGVAPEDLATETMSLAETDRYDGNDKRHGWQVSRSVAARVRRIDRVEQVLQAVVKAGATHIHSLRFAHSRIDEKKVEAREGAMKAARDKAQRMAVALGQQVGKAIVIREGGASHAPLQTNLYVNEAVNAGGAVMSGETLAAGRIRIEVSVAVEFELL